MKAAPNYYNWDGLLCSLSNISCNDNLYINWFKSIIINGGADDKENEKHFAADTDDNDCICLWRITNKCALHSRSPL